MPQRGKWQRKKRDEFETPIPELAIVADADGQTHRVSLQELLTGQQTLKLYDRSGRLLCGKAKLGRDKQRIKGTITRAEIRRVINPPSIEIRAEMP